MKIKIKEWITEFQQEVIEYDIKCYAIVSTWIFGRPLCAKCRKDIKDEALIVAEAESGKVFRLHQECFSNIQE